MLSRHDGRGNRALSKGPIPETARNVALTEDTVKTQLEKLGGTRFEIKGINIKLSEGLALPLSALNAMRRECIEQLEKNFMDYLYYWNEKYYRNGFADVIELLS